METAGRLVAKAGFAATSSKEIATKARVDLASINYHFGSREGLYRAVLIEAHDRIVGMDTLQEVAAAKVPARDKLRLLFGGVLRATRREEWHARVLSRELLSPSAHLRALERTAILPKAQIVLQILSDITGIPIEDPALRRCLVSIVAPCALLVVGEGIGAVADVVHADHEALLAHLLGFALGGLDAVGRSYAEGRHDGRPRRKRSVVSTGASRRNATISGTRCRG